MTKTVCDICGKEMPTQKSVDTNENLNFCISSYGKIWDICTECREELNRWMTIRRGKRREQMAEYIDRTQLETDTEWSEYDDDFISYSKSQINSLPTADVVEREKIKLLGEELRKFREGITDEKVLIGYNMAIAICNKYFGDKE